MSIVKINNEPLYKIKLNLNKFENSKWVKKKCTKTKNNLNILSYNLWGAYKDKIKYPKLYNIKIRGNGLIKLLKDKNVDLLCLQEVSKDWLLFLLKNKYIRDNYYISDINTNRVFMHYGLDNIFLTKVKLDDITVYGLPSLQMDSFLTGKIGDYMIGTFQLHSGSEYTDFRKVQLRTILKIFKNKKFILTGDFNFTDNEEEISIIKHLKDPWNTKKDPGFTEDTYINSMRYTIKGKHKQVRFDKFMYNDSKLIVINQQIIGKDEIKDGIWISDHFGLLTTIKLKSFI